MLEIKPLLPGERRAQYHDLVIGTATCPKCGQNGIRVVNDRGTRGTPETHYLENHHPKEPKGSRDLCEGSEVHLGNL